MVYFRLGCARDAADESSRVHQVNRVNQVAGLRLQCVWGVFQVQATRAPNSFRAVTCLATSPHSPSTSACSRLHIGSLPRVQDGIPLCSSIHFVHY